MTQRLNALVAATLFGVAAVLGVIWHLPVTLMDTLVSWQTQGSLRVVQAEGVFWNGRGVLMTKHGIRLTSTVDWQVRPKAWPLGWAVRLQGDGLVWEGAESGVDIGPKGLRLSAGRLAMPRMDLSVLPGALGLARLSGVPTLSWPALEVLEGRVVGRKDGEVFRARVSDLASGLSPIRPLGEFNFSVALGLEGPGPWHLESSSESVLDLQANGSWSIPLKIDGSLACRRFCDYMTGLMAMIGKPEGERYVLRYGS